MDDIAEKEETIEEKVIEEKVIEEIKDEVTIEEIEEIKEEVTIKEEDIEKDWVFIEEEPKKGMCARVFSSNWMPESITNAYDQIVIRIERMRV